jgi:hypothetical protein
MMRRDRRNRRRKKLKQLTEKMLRIRNLRIRNLRTHNEMCALVGKTGGHAEQGLVKTQSTTRGQFFSNGSFDLRVKF